MKARDFYDFLHKDLQIDFFTGVPDSLLNPFISCLESECASSDMHVIAANEGNAVGLAVGYHLATNRIPCIYMQNSGQGNAVNPIASLTSKDVYGIPCLFVIGWRGEPGVKDEPQHKFQGKITLALLELLDIKYVVIDDAYDIRELKKQPDYVKNELHRGSSFAFVIKKGALENEKANHANSYGMRREKIIEQIIEIAEDAPIICTTGKASRELYELRVHRKETNSHDFLTVGSMGHSSSIALGLALHKPATKVWCIDGDGAALMHMGAMAVIGSQKPKNLVHIVINNEAHETVGGAPTAAKDICFRQIAIGSGYEHAAVVENEKTLREELLAAKCENRLTFIEVKAALGARPDLGRPATSAEHNKIEFMSFVEGKR